MTTQLNLRADQAGVYKGFSAQFSGDGFSDMRFDAAALPADQFEQWVASTKAQGQMLDTAAYTALSRPSKAVAPITYAPVAEGLFETISAGRARADRASQQEH
jgi:cytochrome o ubiquinol oxidase subunit 2